jgi:hypothetical protein
MTDPLFAAVVLITLHAPNGDIITVNPDSITSMRDRAPQNEQDEKLMVKGVECLINTSDGKYVSVLEHCDQVRDMIRIAEGTNK